MAAPKKKARTAPASAEKAAPAKRKAPVKVPAAPAIQDVPKTVKTAKNVKSAAALKKPQKRSKILTTEDAPAVAEKSRVLPNAKHEIFAQEVARGTPLESAYVNAGYKASAKNAARLRKTEGVLRRIEDIQGQAAQNVGLSIEKVLKELAKIGFSDIRKSVRWGDGFAVADDDGEARIVNGVSLVGSDEIDDDTAAAISEVSQTKDGALKIKLHDKRAALVDIGRHMGMFKEKVEHTGKDGAPLVAERTVIVLPSNGRE
jgi:phage terminase small subunit